MEKIKGNGWERVISIEDMKSYLTPGGNSEDFFILLNFGARSSKDITLNEDGTLDILNCIDDSYEENVTEGQLEESFLGEAMEKGAFYKHLP